jgi:hypothetical protein
MVSLRYEVHVASSCVVRDAQTLQHRLSSSKGSGGLAKISSTHPLFFGGWGGTAGDIALLKTRRARAPRRPLDDLDGEVLSDGDEAHESHEMTAAAFIMSCGSDVSADDVPVLLLPNPVASLLVAGRWPSLLLLIRWHRNLQAARRGRASGPIPNWPPPESSVWEAAGAHEQPGDVAAGDFTPDSLCGMRDSLRGWARTVARMHGVCANVRGRGPRPRVGVLGSDLSDMGFAKSNRLGPEYEILFVILGKPHALLQRFPGRCWARRQALYHFSRLLPRCQC